MNTEDAAVTKSNRNDDCSSGWRAFFSVLLIGLCISGNVRPDPSDYKTHAQWRDMVMGVSACSFGALIAACFAIKWRRLPDCWSVIWRLYLAYVVSAFLIGLGHGPGVAASALGASLVAGAFVIPAGAAVFFWRNLLTNVIFYGLILLFCMGVIMVITR